MEGKYKLLEFIMRLPTDNIVNTIKLLAYGSKRQTKISPSYQLNVYLLNLKMKSWC